VPFSLGRDEKSVVFQFKEIQRKGQGTADSARFLSGVSSLSRNSSSYDVSIVPLLLAVVAGQEEEQ
jgi:hypothetical protein